MNTMPCPSSEVTRVESAKVAIQRLMLTRDDMLELALWCADQGGFAEGEAETLKILVELHREEIG